MCAQTSLLVLALSISASNIAASWRYASVAVQLRSGDVGGRCRRGSYSRRPAPRDRRGAQSSLGLALVYLTVQRASRSFWRSLAGFFAHSAGVRPSLISRFRLARLQDQHLEHENMIKGRPATLRAARSVAPPGTAQNPQSHSAVPGHRPWPRVPSGALQRRKIQPDPASATPVTNPVDRTNRQKLSGHRKSSTGLVRV